MPCRIMGCNTLRAKCASMLVSSIAGLTARPPHRCGKVCAILPPPLPGKGCCKHRLQLLQPGQSWVVPDMAQRLPHLVAQTVTDALRDLLLGGGSGSGNTALFGKKLCGINDVLQGGILVALLEEEQGGGVQEISSTVCSGYLLRGMADAPFLQTNGL